MYITNAKAFPVQIIPPCKKELRQLQIFVKISIKHFMVIIIREQTPCSDYKPWRIFTARYLGKIQNSVIHYKYMNYA